MMVPVSTWADSASAASSLPASWTGKARVMVTTPFSMVPA
jgi:hypothetical protein